MPDTFKYPIKNRFTGKVIFEADLAAEFEQRSHGSKLGLAVKAAINNDADLRGAILHNAILRRADLRRADLRRADLRGAILHDAVGLPPERHTDLLMLLDQPGPIRAYKLVGADGNNRIHNNHTIHYQVGAEVSVDNADCDPVRDCGAGINVATLPWCLNWWEPGDRILLVEFTAADIACIPTGTDGKFRLHRCKVVAEKEIDPVALGLVKADEAEAA